MKIIITIGIFIFLSLISGNKILAFDPIQNTINLQWHQLQLQQNYQIMQNNMQISRDLIRQQQKEKQKQENLVTPTIIPTPTIQLPKIVSPTITLAIEQKSEPTSIPTSTPEPNQKIEQAENRSSSLLKDLGFKLTGLWIFVKNLFN